jgi:hypothetical protein
LHRACGDAVPACVTVEHSRRACRTGDEATLARRPRHGHIDTDQVDGDRPRGGAAHVVGAVVAQPHLAEVGDRAPGGVGGHVRRIGNRRATREQGDITGAAAPMTTLTTASTASVERPPGGRHRPATSCPPRCTGWERSRDCRRGVAARAARTWRRRRNGPRWNGRRGQLDDERGGRHGRHDECQLPPAEPTALRGRVNSRRSP